MATNPVFPHNHIPIPTFRLRWDPNRNYGSPIFPLLLPGPRGWLAGQTVYFDPHPELGLDPFHAFLLTGYRYERLQEVSPGLIYLVSGMTDLEAVRQHYRNAWQRQYDLNTTPFYIYLFNRCLYHA